MRKAIVLLLSIFYTISAIAQNNEIEKTIRALDQKNAFLVVKADTTALMNLFAPAFTIHRTTGGIVSGQDKTLELMRQGMVAYDSFAIQTDFVLVKSPILAVSMGSEVVVSGGNRDLKGKVVKRSYTHVWIKEEEGTWQLLVRHASRNCAQ